MIGQPDNTRIPPEGLAMVQRLRQAGYEAWFVGGCVRDLLMGNEPHDWDICTNAKPDQTKAVFAGCRIHETGIKHGTVLVMSGDTGYEITTYRTEQGYSDHRRPDGVVFIEALSGDLARRDFTVNAMAYHPKDGVIDLFGGQKDLKAGVIRAVGDPSQRFGEDALRMLRALRFAGRFSFALEAETARAIHTKRKDLRFVAEERIFSEWKEILTAPGSSPLLLEFADLVEEILPELASVLQRAEWSGVVQRLGAVPPDLVLKLAALFYGTETGQSRADHVAHMALLRLKCDKRTRQAVEDVLRLQAEGLPGTLAELRHGLSEWGEDTMRRMLMLRRSVVARMPSSQQKEEQERLEQVEAWMEEAVAGDSCLTVAQLALSGADLLAYGIPAGPEVGRRLKRALEGVLDGVVPNRKEALLRYVCGE